MIDLKAETTNLLKAKSASPFLFVGSGFSRRYIGLEDWRGLLSKFCDGVGSFEYYVASANGNLPKAAELICKDFHEIWWKDSKYEKSREKYKGTTKAVPDALKNEICEYLQEVSVSGLQEESIQKELSILKEANVDGIITTNWDFLLEEIFPEYRVFVGQEELLFSNPQAIAEIYKIHGCASRPQSLVLTSEDYNDFEEKNPYLAAKLITLFIEHPIFFIGYSVTDPHIQKIIFSIAQCLTPEKLDQFSENLIFVRRSGGKEDSIQKFTFSEGGRTIIATVLETDDFSNVYSAINETKRKIPARILRYCKEQMYELMKSESPEKKIAVIDIDELDASEEVEFVVGVGVAQAQSEKKEKLAEKGEKALAESGYQGINLSDIYTDFAKEKSLFDSEKLLKLAFPIFCRSSTTYIPVFRYLRDVGINTAQELKDSKYTSARVVCEKIAKKSYALPSYKKPYDKYWAGKTTAEIIAGADQAKVAAFIPHQSPENVDLKALRDFILAHKPEDFIDPYSSFYRKLCSFYDRLAYGFDLS
ncbi:MAG: SIR2 family protein [Tabrizicola sp.]|uniref:SIR2 family protein n=1 Tax=Tabrizicola sp. TaxID=2005166 RepID=UPI002AB81747|nr:SIR2 family protein [Tabrizicola sp.]MDZ4087572.1 SIR2 family protein [Tabrizicola sp.]